MPSPSRSSLISFIVSTSRLSYWTTTRSGIVARSMGAMSMSGAAVTSMPPEWIERWRGKPSMRAHSSSQRSQSERPATLPGRGPSPTGRRISAGASAHDRVAAVLAASPPARAPSAARPRSRRPGRPRRRPGVDRPAGPLEPPIGRSTAWSGTGSRTRDRPRYRPVRAARRSRQRSCSRVGAPSGSSDAHRESPGPPSSSPGRPGARSVRPRSASCLRAQRRRRPRGLQAHGSSGAGSWRRAAPRPAHPSSAGPPRGRPANAARHPRTPSRPCRPAASGVVQLAHRVGQAARRGQGRRRLGPSLLPRPDEELREAALGLEVAPDHHAVVRLERLRHPVDERPREPQRVAHLAHRRPRPVRDEVADHPRVLGRRSARRRTG